MSVLVQKFSRPVVSFGFGPTSWIPLLLKFSFPFHCTFVLNTKSLNPFKHNYFITSSFIFSYSLLYQAVVQGNCAYHSRDPLCSRNLFSKRVSILSIGHARWANFNEWTSLSKDILLVFGRLYFYAQIMVFAHGLWLIIPSL